MIYEYSTLDITNSFGPLLFCHRCNALRSTPGLPAPMHWMYELSPIIHYISGAAEILGGLGLILPAVTQIQTRLVPLAASGLTLVMIGAMIFHIQRGEMANIGMNLFLAILLAFVAYGRWKISPLTDRNQQPTE